MTAQSSQTKAVKANRIMSWSTKNPSADLHTQKTQQKEKFFHTGVVRLEFIATGHYGW